MFENNKFRFSLLFCIVLSLTALAAPASAYVSIQPTAVRPYTMTADRLWASTAALLALVAVIIGGLALFRSAGQIGTGKGRKGGIVALVLGLIALVNGGLVLATADGGPGTGNGVVGGAAAFVLGLIALAIGRLALARYRRTAIT